ncbi:diguanylate cyclase [Shewanella putrefaciens]|nr:diguanylate cyclase [Shewanella putrefaciens]
MTKEGVFIGSSNGVKLINNLDVEENITSEKVTTLNKINSNNIIAGTSDGKVFS